MFQEIDDSRIDEIDSNNNKIYEYIRPYRFDILLIVLLSVFLIIMNVSVYSNFQQLPSPIYGGDYYYQMGCVNNVKYGGDAFDNCNLLSENPGYFPLYSFIVGNVAKIFDMGSMQAMFFMSNIFILLSVIISYTLFKIFTDDYMLSCLGVLLFVYFSTPIIKYTQLSTYVITPLFVLALFLFFKKSSYIYSVILGVITGIATIAHSILLPAAFFVLLFFSFYFIFKDYKNLSKELVIERIKFYWLKLVMIATITFIISMLYWYNPLFVSKLSTSSHYLEWNGPGDMSRFSLKMHMLNVVISGMVFKFKGSISIIKSLLILSSIVVFFLVKNKTKKMKFIYTLYIVSLISCLSYFVTIPLFGIHFVPNYMVAVFGSFIALLFGLTGFSILKTQIKSKKIFYIVIAILLVLVLFLQVSVREDYKDNQWFSVGANPLDDLKSGLSEFVVENTHVDDVILTTKEIGFAVNGLTGRKLIASRRAQNDAFEDMDIREMDLAVILYGHDVKEKTKLFEKYDAKYLYWDYYWSRSEFSFDDQGNLQNIFDPLMAFDSPEVRERLDKNNVSYMLLNTYVDPSLRSEYHPTFDLIVIDPSNYYNYTHPWNPNLDEYLEEVWSYEQQGQKIASLFRININ